MNWPSRLATYLDGKTDILYNMSVGGWGPTQYVDIFEKALYLQPLVVVVAYYTGNDPLDSFIQVYGDERWQDWQPDTSITKKDAPAVQYPDERSEQWSLLFEDGSFTQFTPAYRYAANEYENPAVRAGYDIMARSAEEIATRARQYNIRPVFTIIPTKEYVYAKKVGKEKTAPRQDYSLLVEDEQKNINYLASRLQNIPGAIYVDVASRLQNAALKISFLYPPDINGHPNRFGYDIIARTLAPYVRNVLPIKPFGLVYTQSSKEKTYYVVHDGMLLLYDTLETLEGNGWDINRATQISQRFIDNIKISTHTITTIEPERYGPKALFPD
jgi:hypothetical protein